MTIAAVAGVEPHEAGLASGLINTRQQVGGALGLAILAAIANSRTRRACSRRAASLPDALTEGFQTRADGRRRRSRSSARSLALPAGRRPSRSRRRARTASSVPVTASHGTRARRRPAASAASTHSASSPGIELDAGGGEAASAAFAAVAAGQQARGVPPERAEARVLPVVPQRAVGGVEDVVEVRVAVQRAGSGSAAAPSVGVQLLEARAAASSPRRRRSTPRRRGGRAAPRPRSRPSSGSEPSKSRSASWQ